MIIDNIFIDKGFGPKVIIGANFLNGLTFLRNVVDSGESVITNGVVTINFAIEDREVFPPSFAVGEERMTPFAFLVHLARKFHHLHTKGMGCLCMKTNVCNWNWEDADPKKYKAIVTIPLLNTFSKSAANVVNGQCQVSGSTHLWRFNETDGCDPFRWVGEVTTITFNVGADMVSVDKVYLKEADVSILTLDQFSEKLMSIF